MPVPTGPCQDHTIGGNKTNPLVGLVFRGSYWLRHVGMWVEVNLEIKVSQNLQHGWG